MAKLTVPDRFSSLKDYYEFCRFASTKNSIPKIFGEVHEKYQSLDLNSERPEFKNKVEQLFMDYFPTPESVGYWSLVFEQGIKKPERWNQSFYEDTKFEKLLYWFAKHFTKNKTEIMDYLTIAVKGRVSFWKTRSNYIFPTQARHVVQAQQEILNPNILRDRFITELEQNLDTYVLNSITYENFIGQTSRVDIVRWPVKPEDPLAEAAPIPYFVGLTSELFDAFPVHRFLTATGNTIDVSVLLITMVETNSRLTYNGDSDETASV